MGQVKTHIRKGDTVKVIAGNDKGKTGVVASIDLEKQRAIVKGNKNEEINMVTKHVKPSAANPEGGIQRTEAGVHISNLMVVDPSTGDQTRVGRKLNDDGKLQRFSKKSGEFITNG